jgi:hypothetical protein
MEDDGKPEKLPVMFPLDVSIFSTGSLLEFGISMKGVTP